MKSVEDLSHYNAQFKFDKENTKNMQKSIGKNLKFLVRTLICYFLKPLMRGYQYSPSKQQCQDLYDQYCQYAKLMSRLKMVMLAKEWISCTKLFPCDSDVKKNSA